MDLDINRFYDSEKENISPYNIIFQETFWLEGNEIIGSYLVIPMIRSRR